MGNHNQESTNNQLKDLPLGITIAAPFLTAMICYIFDMMLEPCLIILTLFSIHWIYRKDSYIEKRASGVLLGSISLALISEPMMIASLVFATVGYIIIRIRTKEELANELNELN